MKATGVSCGVSLRQRHQTALQSWLLLSLLGDDGGIGAEGLAQQLVRLLDAASHDPAGERLAVLPAVRTLRRGTAQQLHPGMDGCDLLPTMRVGLSGTASAAIAVVPLSRQLAELPAKCSVAQDMLAATQGNQRCCAAVHAHRDDTGPVCWLCAGGVLQGLQAAPCTGADRSVPCPPTGQSAAPGSQTSSGADAAAGGGGALTGAAARAAWAQRLRVVQEALILLRTLLRDRDLGTWLFASPVMRAAWQRSRGWLSVTCSAPQAGATLQLWPTKGGAICSVRLTSIPVMPAEGAIQARGG